MAYFQLGDRQFQLKAGSQRVGPAGTGAEVELPGGASMATAVVVVNTDGTVVIQRGADDSVVVVNKVELGAEPSPLFHGDHVEMGGHDLRFGDTKQGGSTQFVSGSEVAAYLKARQSTPAKPTSASGGRLVSQLDGREYEVPASGLVIGRDPSADIVVPRNEVSRRHVQIAPAGNGYLLSDLSTNGVWVNGERVEKEQALGRGDVIRVANEEFRFYADVMKPAVEVVPAAPAPVPVTPAPAASETPAPPASLTPAAPIVAVPSPAEPVHVPVSATPVPAMMAVPPVPAPPSAPAPSTPAPPSAPITPVPASTHRAALATLEVLNQGPAKGDKVEVHSALTNIGRGAHNDLVIANESVSDSHAKLQKREQGWFIVDIDSTNGTYVGGHRIHGEQALVGAPDLRFGDVKVAFRPATEVRESGKSTRVVAGATLDEVRRAAARRAEGAASAAAAPAVSNKPAAKPAMSAPPAAVPVPNELHAAPQLPADAPAPKHAPAWFWGLLILIGAVVIGVLYLRGA